ncbi:MAG TPA: class I SAM-dependent methyltransferase, partial [Usitatibacter sp.]|nr:class I SAM-dependent methyltransferase [Usitatibacter sp.]
MKCRHCHKQLEHVFLDLATAPPSNNYLSKDDLGQPEARFPLRLFVCDECWLVQTEDFARADELFKGDYAYFSSTSRSWLDHAARYTEMIVKRLGLGRKSFVIEVASNDGYLLKNFVAAGIPCLGVEPTDSTADAAEKLGVPVLREFFGVKSATELAKQGKQADLIAGNNVYAHVPDINDFTQGLRIALKPGGTITLEFPHLLRLIEQNQFDTVYHEHFSYLSLTAVERIFRAAGLRVLDVEEIPTHGGSLRVYGCHPNDARPSAAAVAAMLDREKRFGLTQLATYRGFQKKADKVRDDFKRFLEDQKRAGKTVAGYGAAAKGNTLINYAGVGQDLIAFVCDAAPSKQGKFLPGSRIPILQPAAMAERRPDFVVILPWNIAEEVRQQQAVGAWGGKFVVAVPEL